MSKKQISDVKIACDVLKNKIANLIHYQNTTGNKIFESLTSNIKQYDDIFVKSFNEVDLQGCGGEKYISDEIRSVTSIYNDLLNKINSSNVGCGESDEVVTDMGYDRDFVKDIASFKNNFMKILSKSRDNKQKPKKNVKNTSYEINSSSLLPSIDSGDVIAPYARAKPKQKSKKSSKKEPRKKSVSKKSSTKAKKAIKDSKNNIIF